MPDICCPNQRFLKQPCTALLLCAANILNVLLSRFKTEKAIINIFSIVMTEVDFHLLRDTGSRTFN